MGTISVNKLGGLCLILGPVVALVFYFLTPGGMLIDAADPADAQASITAIVSNSGFSHLTSFVVPLGLIMMLYGVLALQSGIREGGNGDALSRFGVLSILIAIISWMLTSGLGHVLAADAGQAAGPVYAVSQAINAVGGITAAFGFLLLSLAISTRDDSNKMLAMIVALASMVGLVVAIIGITDSSQLQLMAGIQGITFIITALWAITLGMAMVKKG